jgi:hypothetical protein
MTGKMIKLSLSVFLIALALTEACPAQDNSSTIISQRVSFDVSFKATDAFVDDVKISEIHLDGIGMSNVTAIDDIGALPLRVVILIDLSASQMRGEFRQYYSEMIKSLSLRNIDSACLAVFYSDKISLVQDFTSDQDLLLKRAGNLPHPAGETRLLDALFLSSKSLGARPEFRKAVIVFTDGHDTGSRTTIRAAYDDAVANNVRVFMFVKRPLQLGPSTDAALRESVEKHKHYVNETGGRIIYVSDLKHDQKQMMQLMDELNHLKRISIDAPGPVGPDFKITVSRKGVKVSYPSPLK